MDVFEYNTEIKRVKNARMFFLNFEHAIDKTDCPESVRHQLRCIGYSDELKATMKESLNLLENSLHKQLEESKSSDPVFIMLVGIPGSGKSYFAKNFESDYKVHSSDSIRAELYGSQTVMDKNNVVFEVLHKRVVQDLKAGQNVIYDATNISYKRRKGFLTNIKSIPCRKVAIVIATPFEVCLAQNKNRDRVVPEDVLYRMREQFDIPFYNEGWDNISIYYPNPAHHTYYGSNKDFIARNLHFDQKNSHHRLSLGAHCIGARDYVDIVTHQKGSIPLNFRELREAALLHDCGKPKTQVFHDSKGCITTEAHYYNHEHVGCYDSLFYSQFDEDGVMLDKLYISALIRWHMILHHFNKWNPMAIEKYTNEFKDVGLSFWENLLLLHEGDVFAH